MKQILLNSGSIVVDQVPDPPSAKNKILVKVQYSCISAGTELAGIDSSGASLIKRALAQPEKIFKVYDMVHSNGLFATRDAIKRQSSTSFPMGYSAAGTVIDVGANVKGFKAGDHVACAGVGFASHAEIISVPEKLTVLFPPNVTSKEASTVTLGAIALQGVRRANPTIGETFVVFGLGILGQITAQLLKANGCRVIGIDLLENRLKLASDLGMHFGINAQIKDKINDVKRIHGSQGVDGVIITASSATDQIISDSFQMCRKKGRVVLVGDVGLRLKRGDFYKNEIDFLISTSYGPGRYDNSYELDANDYPLGYVRWTENRNMQAYIGLISNKNIQITPLISNIFPLHEAAQAFASFRDSNSNAIINLLEYDKTDTYSPKFKTEYYASKSSKNKVGISIIGAGGFACSVHLPNILHLSKDYELQGVMTSKGHNATNVAKQFKAKYATTDYSSILEDPETDSVIIATRHDIHEKITIDALKAGKHVLVEKPLSINQEQLNTIIAFNEQNQENLPIIMTGFNRRFSPLIQKVKSILSKKSNPMIINYRMNAGYIPLDHWVHSEQGGGRNIGEASHIYDLFTYLTDSKVVKVDAQPTSTGKLYFNPTDNFVATLTFEDGSVASLTYTAFGAKDYPKEKMEIFCDGMVISLNDYKKLEIVGAKKYRSESRRAQKGHREELVAFVSAIKHGGTWPILFWQQQQATEISFLVNQMLTK